jgi:hypothetical protein
MSLQTFTEPKDLSQVNDLINDRWFDVTQIREEGTDLLIPYASHAVSRAADALFDSALRIGAARSWRVVDTEQVAIYDLAGMSYDEARGRLTIEGNIPLTIEVEVARFDVSLDYQTG